jgi:myo-inositol-1(or 4)-monophosphatase
VDALAFAVALAREAGDLLVASSGAPLEVGEKGLHGDLVTGADRASEALIVERLRRDWPRSSILAEESGAYRGESHERWIVDPLDGTTNYAHNYPLYCVSIAYERDGVVVAGVVHAPAIGELYAAELGGGATCNDTRIAVSGVRSVGAALVCTGFMPARYERNARQFAALSRRAQAVRRDGAAALDLAFTAAGRFDAFWEYDLHAWDVAAGALLVGEAGGTVTTADGGTFQLDGASILATNGRTHGEMVACLQEAAPSDSA